MMKRLLSAAVFALLLPSLALAQSTVIQGGSFTAGHVPQYNTSSGQPTLRDGGTSAGTSAAGGNPSTLGITARCSNPPCIAQGAGPNGEDAVIYDGPTGDADGYHYLGFSANIGSKATITTGAAGGAAAQGLQFIIDGTTYDFPGDFPLIPVTVPNGGTGRTSLTDYNLLVGAGTSNVGLVAPSAISGVPLVSQGSSANPAYGTAAVAGGGTGATTANGALNNLLPAQSGQNGKVLATDGSNAAWTSIPGTGTVTQVNTDATLQGGPITTSGTLGLADAADGSILANISGSAGQPTATTLSAIFDDQIGSGQGTLAMRGAATWGALTPGTTGLPLLSAGPGNNLAYGQLSITNLNIAGQTTGDLAYFDGATWTRLGIGTSGQALSGGSVPTWQAINGTQIRMGSDAQGDIMYFNGTNYVRLPAGTSGQVLQTQGAGANPQWANASAAGRWALISTSTLSSTASVSLTGFDPALYSDYVIVIDNALPSNDNVDFIVRTSTDGGATYDSGASDYTYVTAGALTGTGAVTGSSTGAAQIEITAGVDVGNVTGEGLTGRIYITNPGAAQRANLDWKLGGKNGSGNIFVINGDGQRQAAADVNGVYIGTTAGSMASGVIRFYGLTL